MSIFLLKNLHFFTFLYGLLHNLKTVVTKITDVAIAITMVGELTLMLANVQHFCLIFCVLFLCKIGFH